ncbi:MAG: pentapeptide repeat-containing protein [Planctomycetes bacterium]|nr:pentapeptide repeat-containing protein [Planctomycetota bacterium]
MVISTDRSAVIFVSLSLLGLCGTLAAPPAAADIFRWDNGELITEGNAEPDMSPRGIDLSYADLEGAQLSNADFSGADLTYARLRSVVATGGDFRGANLTNADFWHATLADADFSGATFTDADFSGALVARASFKDTTSRGFTAEHLYSTASYQSGDLSHMNLEFNDFSGWSFAGKNMTDTLLFGATLTAADFSEANLTQAYIARAVLNGADLREGQSDGRPS